MSTEWPETRLEGKKSLKYRALWLGRGMDFKDCGKPLAVWSRDVVIFQLLSHVWLFVTQWTAAHQASLSFTIYQSLLKLMSIESVMPSNHLILCHPLLCLPSVFPSIRVFPVSRLFTYGSQSIGASASASVLPMNIQGWFPLGLTSLISLLSRGLSRVFSGTTIWIWNMAAH